MKTLHFACGASYEIESDPPKNKVGNLASILVRVMGQEKPKAPKLDGREMNCLHACPARVRDSKRKEQYAWIGEAAIKPEGEPVRCVLCTPTHLSGAKRLSYVPLSPSAVKNQ